MAYSDKWSDFSLCLTYTYRPAVHSSDSTETTFTSFTTFQLVTNFQFPIYVTTERERERERETEWKNMNTNVPVVLAVFMPDASYLGHESRSTLRSGRGTEPLQWSCIHSVSAWQVNNLNGFISYAFHSMSKWQVLSFLVTCTLFITRNGIQHGCHFCWLASRSHKGADLPWI
jgi:hypothetical protein